MISNQNAYSPKIFSTNSTLNDEDYPDLDFSDCSESIGQSSFKILSKNISDLSAYEEDEILLYENIYFFGQGSAKISGNYSDELGNYIVVIGDHIAYRYEIVSVNGRGTFGEVLECIDRKLMKQVAIKVLNNKPKYSRAGKMEVKILEKLKKIDHYKILLQMLEYFEFRGHFFIVFEYLHENLFQYLEKRQFHGIHLQSVKSIARQVLHSLLLLHSIDGIHCDIKPDNIMLKGETLNEIKLIDYGLTCFQGDKLLDYVQSRHYRAPEIVLGCPYSEKIDIWSVGCLLYECLTGQILFPAESESELLVMIQKAIGPPPKELLRSARFKENYFDSRGMLKVGAGLEICGKIDNCGDKKFAMFLKLCLKWSPRDRISAGAALVHPWLV